MEIAIKNPFALPIVIIGAGQDHDRLHLHTVRDLSNLPGTPFPSSYPEFVHKNDLIRYYENYALEHEIKPLFGQSVDAIQKKVKFLLNIN